MKKTRKSLLLLAPVMISMLPQLHAAGKLSGAIFTTTVDGAIVNANTQYGSKCDVYLNGGPGPHAPARAAGLPDQDYYFQVTDPSGAALLSTDKVSARRFTVIGGVIAGYSGSGGPVHPAGVSVGGGRTIRLANQDCPSDFLDTSNGGGVYKVWVTPVNAFVGNPDLVDNVCGNGCVHGFIPSMSKTDNFKVSTCLTVNTLVYSRETNEVTPVGGWYIFVTDAQGVSNVYNADANGQFQLCPLSAGHYLVEEGAAGNGFQYELYQLFFNGTQVLPVPGNAVYELDWAPGTPSPAITFVNVLAREQ